MPQSAAAPTFIDLFAGCGGLSLGLMSAGWKGLFAIEKDPMAFETLSHNLLSPGTAPVKDQGEFRFEWPESIAVKNHNITTLVRSRAEILKGLRESVDLVAGGPPCQGFSFAGKRQHSDPRNRLFRDYVKFVDLVQPRFLILENVRGITVGFEKEKKGNRGPAFVEQIEKALGRLTPGYTVFYDVVTATSAGVPQYRSRLILIGVRRDLEEGVLPGSSPRVISNPLERLPAIRSHFLQSKGLPDDYSLSTADAISDLRVNLNNQTEKDSQGFCRINYRPASLKGKLRPYQELMRSGLNGEPPNSLRLARHTERVIERFSKIHRLCDIGEDCQRGVQLPGRVKELLGTRKQAIHPLHPDRPAPTVTTLPDDIIHFDEPRILTVREMARLQSFPDWFRFRGKYTTGGERRKLECPRYSQVGNAVPPLLAELIGVAVMELRDELCKISVS